MRHFLPITSTLLGVGLLASCALSDVKPDYTLKHEGPKGLLAASFTYHGGPMSYLSWRVRPAPKPGTPLPSTDSGTDPVIQVFGPANLNVDWPPPIGMSVPASRLAGRVAVVELAPGTYDLYKWEGNTTGFYLSSGSKPLVIRFKIEAGKATYIGDVHMFWENPRYRVGVFDMRDRDLPRLKKKVPLLAEEQLVIALAEMPEKSSQPPAGK